MKEALTRKPDRHLRNRPIRPNRQLVDSKAASKRIRTSIHRIHLNYPDDMLFFITARECRAALLWMSRDVLLNMRACAFSRFEGNSKIQVGPVWIASLFVVLDEGVWTTRLEKESDR